MAPAPASRDASHHQASASYRPKSIESLSKEGDKTCRDNTSPRPAARRARSSRFRERLVLWVWISHLLHYHVGKGRPAVGLIVVPAGNTTSLAS